MLGSQGPSGPSALAGAGAAVGGGGAAAGVVDAAAGGAAGTERRSSGEAWGLRRSGLPLGWPTWREIFRRIKLVEFNLSPLYRNAQAGGLAYRFRFLRWMTGEVESRADGGDRIFTVACVPLTPSKGGGRTSRFSNSSIFKSLSSSFRLAGVAVGSRSRSAMAEGMVMADRSWAGWRRVCSLGPGWEFVGGGPLLSGKLGICVLGERLRLLPRSSWGSGCCCCCVELE